MNAGEPVSFIPPADRVAQPSGGMVREQAVATAGMWAGLARTQPGADSGWHHHGDYESTIYVVSGQMQMESGPGGGTVVVGGPGDFLYVPPGAIHRESNPGNTESHLVVVRGGGSGPPVISVDGPAPA
ncbi:MAG: cupin domain-containing protein [Acidimicrobiia bacterium]